MSKETITNMIRWVLKVVLIFLSFVIMIMPFIPAFKEYVFDYPEKEFGSKEVVIFCLGILIFTGGIFSNTILTALKNAFKNVFNFKITK